MIPARRLPLGNRLALLGDIAYCILEKPREMNCGLGALPVSSGL